MTSHDYSTDIIGDIICSVTGLPAADVLGPALAVCVQVDLAVQVKHLRLQGLGESPQSDAATLTGRQLSSDTQTTRWSSASAFTCSSGSWFLPHSDKMILTRETWCKLLLHKLLL